MILPKTQLFLVMVSNSHFESFTVQAELVVRETSPAGKARSPFDKLRANGELKAYKAILRIAE